jgi:hypothetical protein
MQTQLNKTVSADSLRGTTRPSQTTRASGSSRRSGGLSRSAAAATELPFSALFYWVD